MTAENTTYQEARSMKSTLTKKDIYTKLENNRLPYHTQDNKSELLARMHDFDRSQSVHFVTQGINVRKYQQRIMAEMNRPQDVVTAKMTIEWLDEYLKNREVNRLRNELLQQHNPNHKRLRNANFRSECSENIAKFTLYAYFGKRPNWNTETGDLFMSAFDKYLHRRIEVKGVSSDGPPSFGKKEEWDWLVFVILKTASRELQVLLVDVSNTSETMRSIQMTTEDSFGTSCARVKGQRPRMNIDVILSQIPAENQNMLFSGTIEQWYEKHKTLI